MIKVVDEHESGRPHPTHLEHLAQNLLHHDMLHIKVVLHRQLRAHVAHSRQLEPRLRALQKRRHAQCVLALQQPILHLAPVRLYVLREQLHNQPQY